MTVWIRYLLYIFCVILTLLSDLEVAPALWVCHRPGAIGTAHCPSESIRGHSLDWGRACGCGYFQLESANQSAAHQPGLGILYVPLYRDQQHFYLTVHVSGGNTVCLMVWCYCVNGRNVTVLGSKSAFLQVVILTVYAQLALDSKILSSWNASLL